MATGAKKPAAGGTEDKLRDMMRETVAEVLGAREKESRSKSETREQQWLRGAIREEVAGFFEGFLADLEPGKRSAEGGEPEEEEGGGLLSLFGGGGGRK